MSDPLDEADGARTTFVERYKADRALELEISKFSGSLERSFLQAAAVLNGGSATVFLSFVGTTVGRVRVSTPLLATTFVLWLVGLVASLVAGFIAYRSQDFFGRAVRNRRDAAGVTVLGGSYTRSMGVLPSDDAAVLAKRAGERQVTAESLWRWATWIGVASVILFGLGAGFALGTVLTAVPIGRVP